MTRVEFTREDMPTVQEMLDGDTRTVPAPLREVSTRSFGLEEIPIDRYVTRDFHELEMKELWSRVWQFACREEDIPNVGDYLVYEVGSYSALIVRSEPERIQAFHNVCLHRGTQLAEGTGNCAKIVCPFHGWSWALSGALRSVPCKWDFPQVSGQDFSLPEARIETWDGSVFLNFNPDAGPLVEHLDVLPEHFKSFPLKDRFTAAHVSKVVGGNWKVGVDAFLESYHTVETHPQLLQSYGDANSQYDVWSTVSRLITPGGVPSPHLGDDVDPQTIYENNVREMVPGGGPAGVLPEGVSPRTALADTLRTALGAMSGHDLSAISDTELVDAVQYFTFPNWFPWGSSGLALMYRFRPNGDDPDTHIMDVRFLLSPPPGVPKPPSAPVRHLTLEESWTDAVELGPAAFILSQDAYNLPRIQHGLKAALRRGITLGDRGVSPGDYQESRIRHFHQLLEQWLGL